jgi:hypothetical protein
MFQGMLNFEKKFNKQREEHDKKVICFGYHKEGHTIHLCFLLFPHLKGTDGTSRQDRKYKLSRPFSCTKWDLKCEVGSWALSNLDKLTFPFKIMLVW